MDFEKFPKIENIGRALRENTVAPGIYLISEKLDGANAGIVRTPEGLLLHSRNTFLAWLSLEDPLRDQVDGTLRGFVPHVDAHREALGRAIKVGEHVYGEWLVPHTVKYPAEMYQQFYAFPQRSLLKPWPLELAHVFGDAFYFNGDTAEYLLSHCQQLVDQLKEQRGYDPEGVVLVNTETGEQYKFVTDAHREDSKHKWSAKASRKAGDIEQGLAALFSLRRYEKVREKAFDIKGKLDKSETPIVMQLAWDDFCQELLADGFKEFGFPIVDTKALKHAVGMRAREMFHTEIDTGMLPQWALHGERVTQP